MGGLNVPDDFNPFRDASWPMWEGGESARSSSRQLFVIVPRGELLRGRGRIDEFLGRWVRRPLRCTAVAAAASAAATAAARAARAARAAVHHRAVADACPSTGRRSLAQPHSRSLARHSRPTGTARLGAAVPQQVGIGGCW